MEVYGAFKEAAKKAASTDFRFHNFGIFTGINSEFILQVIFQRDSVIGKGK